MVSGAEWVTAAILTGHLNKPAGAGEGNRTQSSAPAEPSAKYEAYDENRTTELERVKGIEPSYSAWKAAALPLSYTRAGADMQRPARQINRFVARPFQPPIRRNSRAVRPAASRGGGITSSQRGKYQRIWGEGAYMVKQVWGESEYAVKRTWRAKGPHISPIKTKAASDRRPLMRRAKPGPVWPRAAHESPPAASGCPRGRNSPHC